MATATELGSIKIEPIFLEKWISETDKFVLCLNYLDISLTVEGETFCTAAVDVLEDRLERAAGILGFKGKEIWT